MQFYTTVLTATGLVASRVPPRRSMYSLGSPFDDATVKPGTNLLVTGPPLVGKRRLAMDTLTTERNPGEGIIIVSARDSAVRIRQAFETASDESSTVGIVDAVTRHIGRSVESELTKTTPSPRDMSAIGIKFSEFIDAFYTEQKRERNRVFVDSLSTLLLYSNLQAVFQFLHVFTSRVENVDALGLYTIDGTAHDDESMDTIRQLFDGEIAIDTAGRATLTLPDGDCRTARR